LWLWCGLSLVYDGCIACMDGWWVPKVGVWLYSALMLFFFSFPSSFLLFFLLLFFVFVKVMMYTRGIWVWTCQIFWRWLPLLFIFSPNVYFQMFIPNLYYEALIVFLKYWVPPDSFILSYHCFNILGFELLRIPVVSS
jgi:hypothetical protein